MLPQNDIGQKQVNKAALQKWLSCQNGYNAKKLIIKWNTIPHITGDIW